MGDLANYGDAVRAIKRAIPQNPHEAAISSPASDEIENVLAGVIRQTLLAICPRIVNSSVATDEFDKANSISALASADLPTRVAFRQSQLPKCSTAKGIHQPRLTKLLEVALIPVSVGRCVQVAR